MNQCEPELHRGRAWPKLIWGWRPVKSRAAVLPGGLTYPNKLPPNCLPAPNSSVKGEASEPLGPRSRLRSGMKILVDASQIVAVDVGV